MGSNLVYICPISQKNISMKKIFALLAAPLLLGIPGVLSAQNQPPLLSNLVVTPDWPNLSLDVQYEVYDDENDPLEIVLQLSDNAGRTYTITNQISATGDIGFPVQPGSKNITCDLSGLNNTSGAFTLRLIADDKKTFDIQALVNEVDSNRLRADLEFVEGIRHRTTGQAHLEATRDSIKNLFLAAGLHYQEQAVPFANYSGKNLIGTLPGTSSAEKVVINDAHYDTVNNAPGADDNGSGTVGVMEAARLMSRYPFRKSLRFIGFDLEESGLVGSTRYVSTGIPLGDQIEGVFNHEMIGYWSDEPNSQTLPQGFPLVFPAAAAAVAANQYRGDFITNVGNTASQPLALLFSNAAQEYVPDLKVITLDVPGNGQIAPDLRRSDHTPFWEASKQAIMLTDGANFRNECYHTPGDTLDEKLNFTFLSNVVKATIAAMAELAEIQHGDWATADFQGKVSTNTGPREPCTVHVTKMLGQHNTITITLAGCPFTDATVELYDMKGSLLLQERMSVMPDDPQNFFLPTAIVPGTYAVKIRHEGGILSQKVILR